MEPKAPSLSPRCCPLSPPGWGDTREGCPLPSTCGEPWLRPAAWTTPRLGRGCRVELAGSGPVSHRSPRRRWGGSGPPSTAPALGGPLPDTRRTRSAGGADSAPPACTHALGPASAWGGGQHLQTVGIRPRLASPVPPNLSQCPQHPQSLSVNRSLSVLLTPVLVAVGRARRSGGVLRSEETRTRVCGVMAGGGGTGDLGAVCHTCFVYHTCTVRLHI